MVLLNTSGESSRPFTLVNNFFKMFSSYRQLEKKTGPYGIGRFSYLQKLVTEFQDSDSEEIANKNSKFRNRFLNYLFNDAKPLYIDAKEQVLANLANFAYDPVNYEYLRRLNVIDLFLDCLTETNEKFVEFAIGGLCNLSLDKENKKYILDNDGVKLVTACLSRPVENTVLNAMTTLMYLMTPESASEVTALPIIDAMLRFSKSSNPRLSNLATIFLEDYCKKHQIDEAMQLAHQMNPEESQQDSTSSAGSETVT